MLVKIITMDNPGKTKEMNAMALVVSLTVIAFFATGTYRNILEIRKFRTESEPKKV